MIKRNIFLWIHALTIHIAVVSASLRNDKTRNNNDSSHLDHDHEDLAFSVNQLRGQTRTEKSNFSTQSRRRLPITDVQDDEFDDGTLNTPPWNNQTPTRFSSITESGGTLTLIPNDTEQYGFYGTFEGGFISQSISGGTNFIIEASLTVSDLNGNQPGGDWHSSGILARSSTDTRDYATINLGRQGAAFGMPLTYGTQTLSTTDNQSEFAYLAGPLSGLLRICRVGNDITLLRNLGGEGWIAVPFENGTSGGPFSRPDLAGDLDIGIVLNRYRPGAFQSVFDHVHFAQPMNNAECFFDDLDNVGQTDAPTPSPGPGIEILSDEFSYSNSINDWTNHYPTQHSDNGVYIYNGILTVDVHDADLFQPSNAWFNSNHGNFLSKRLSGNFLVETHVSVRRVAGGVVSNDWNVGGLAARSANDDGNWVVINLGRQGDATQWYHNSLIETVGVEGKTTVNNVSTFNYVARDPNTGPFQEQFQAGRLRICRVGTEFLLLFIVADAPMDWTVVNPFPTENNPGPFTRTDISDEVDVGIMTNAYNGGAADAFSGRFDYVRYGSVTSLDDCYGSMTVI